MTSAEALEKILKKAHGGVVSYYRKQNNAAHHQTSFGQLIAATQYPFYNRHIAATTHVGLFAGKDSLPPKPGFLQEKVLDTFRGGIVGENLIERDYAIEIFILKKGILHPPLPITGEILAEKALEVGKQMKGMGYSDWTLLKTLVTDQAWQGRKYTEWLCQRFQVNPTTGTFVADKSKDTIICPEFVLVCYQIAWILLAGKSAMRDPLPDFINLHCHNSPAGIVQFLKNNPAWETVPAELIHELRYSGTPHPNDGPKPQFKAKL